MNKKGSAAEWVILLAGLIISVVAFIMVLTVPYSKTEVDTKVNSAIIEIQNTTQELSSEIDKKADSPGCEYIMINHRIDIGKTYNDICKAKGKTTQLYILTRELGTYLIDLDKYGNEECVEDTMINRNFQTLAHDITDDSSRVQGYNVIDALYDSGCQRHGGITDHQVREIEEGVLCC